MHTLTRTLIAILACVLFSQVGFPQIYKWKDKDGNTIVSTTPPPPGLEYEKKHVEEVPQGSKPSVARSSRPLTEDSEFRKPYRDVKVIMYVTDWCSVCHRARAFLKSLGVKLTEYDVEKDAERQKEWLRKAAGHKGVPLIDIEGIVLLGFNPGKVRAAIEEKRIF